MKMFDPAKCEPGTLFRQLNTTNICWTVESNPQQYKATHKNDVIMFLKKMPTDKKDELCKKFNNPRTLIHCSDVYYFLIPVHGIALMLMDPHIEEDWYNIFEKVKC